MTPLFHTRHFETRQPICNSPCMSCMKDAMGPRSWKKVSKVPFPHIKSGFDPKDCVLLLRSLHLVRRGVEGALVVLPQRPQTLLDILPDLVQSRHLRHLTLLPDNLHKSNVTQPQPRGHRRIKKEKHSLNQWLEDIKESKKKNIHWINDYFELNTPNQNCSGSSIY